jgi:hypothetical protein
MDSSSSSSLVLVESESNIFTLLIEPDMIDRSAGPEEDHRLLYIVFGDPNPDQLAVFLRWGMATARPPTIGEESGEDSANVE